MNAPLRPLSTGELLDTTFSLYRGHFVLFVGLVAIPYLVLLPFQILNVLLRPQGFDFALSSMVMTLVIALLTLATNAASQGATLIAVSQLYLGRPPAVMGSLSKMKGRIVGLCILTFVMGLGIVAGTLLLIVPGVLLALMWALAVPVMVLEEETIGKSLSRSSELTKGSRGRILLIYVLFLVITLVVSILLGLPIGIINVIAVMENGPATVLPGWVLILNLVTSFVTRSLVGPLMTIAIAVLYYDTRVRKEAFDLQLMMTALDGAGADSPGGQAGA
jgi:hypothetical protein